MQRYSIGFKLSTQLVLDDKELLKVLERPLRDIPKEDHPYILIEIARTIAERKLHLKLEDEHQSTSPWTIKDDGAGEHGQSWENDKE